MFRRSGHKQVAASLQAPPSPTEKKEDDPFVDYSVQSYHGQIEQVSERNKDDDMTLSKEQRQEKFRAGLLHIFMKYVLNPVYDFFHARTGPKGCRVSGWIRLWFSVIFLYSRILFALELDFLIDPVNGVMPYRVTKADMADHEWSIFQLAPDSRLLIYGVFYAGLLAGLGLFLGVLPRWSAVTLFITMHNIHNHNWILWDNQEHMFRLWCFFLIFMPLDNITIYDGYGGWCQRVKTSSLLVNNLEALERHVSACAAWVMKKCPSVIRLQCKRLRLDQDLESGVSATAGNNHRHEQSTSWPMWPFRIFQIYICIVYLAAGLCKLNTTPWRTGTALWWLYYDGGFGRFFPEWVSEYLFNRMGPVKFQTWTALVIEIASIFTIWIPRLRWPTFLGVVALHVGIELALVMHAFEYLSVLGWCAFFVYPNDDITGGKTAASAGAFAPGRDSPLIHQSGSEDGNEKINKKMGVISQMLAPSRRKVLVESCLVACLLFFFTVDALPRGDILQVVPRPVGFFMKYFMFPSSRTRRLANRYGEILGIHTGAWTVYKGVPPHSDYKLTAVIQYNNGTAPTVWEEEDLYSHNDLYSLYMRERTYWSGTFTYYLANEYAGSHDGIPFFGSFAIHLAREYSDGYITIKPRRLGGPKVYIDPNSPIKSVSLMAHKARGLKPPPNVGLWESVPRRWEYTDTCNYVLDLKEFGIEFKKKKLYEYDKATDFERESGCRKLHKIDEELHMKHGSLRPRIEQNTNQ
jgi:hypothetical protein